MGMPTISITFDEKEINLFPYLAGLSALMAILKLVGWISVSWLIVFAPLWIAFVIFAAVFIYLILFVGGRFTITNPITGKKRKFEL